LTKFLQLDSKKIEIQWYNTLSHNQQVKNNHKNLPVLIFLHEGLGCTRMWKKFPEKLAKKKTQIKNYILIGHSDGGSIGIIFAGSPHHKQIKGLKGLITEAAHVFCEQICVDCIQQAKINYEKHNLKQGLEKYHGKNTDNAFYGWNNIWLNPKFMQWNIEKYLNKIQVPMLAIQGKEDQYGTKKQLDSLKRKVNRIETNMLDNCRHSPHNDQPDIVLNLMSQFIHGTIESK